MDPKTVEAVNTLKSHYNLEQKDVLTNNGIGSVFTPLTHHKDEYLPDHLKQKHLLGDPVKSNEPTVHPQGKTSTISNNSFFVKNDALKTDNVDEKVEFSERSSILKRINPENFHNHILHQREVATKKIYDIMDQTEVYIIEDSNNEETPVKVIIDKETIKVFLD